MRVTADFAVTEPLPVCSEDMDDIYTALEGVGTEAGLELQGITVDYGSDK